MLRILGPRLPADLAVEILLKEPTEYLSIDTIEDALKWDIELEKFQVPWPRRSGFLQACQNYFTIKRRVPISGLTVGEASPADTEPPPPPLNGVPAQTDDDSGIEKLIKLERLLLPENHEHLKAARKEFRAPNLLRMVYIGNGEAAAQFLFDAGDTRGAVACTIWGGYWGLNVSEKLLFKLDHENLEREMRNGHTTHIPYWYEFPPDTRLSSISGDF